MDSDRPAKVMLDARQKGLYDAWRRLAAERGGLPLRRDFDPVDYPRALSTLVLAEVMPGTQICYRLVGTDMVSAWGADFTGRYLHEVMQGDYHDFIRSLFDDCIAQQSPIYSHSRFQWDRGRAVDTRRIMLPFARDETPKDVGFVLVSQVFDFSKVGPAHPTVTADPDFTILELTREQLQAAGGD